MTKVLHIVAGEINGGAARGAFWLHKELLNQEVNSKLLTNTYISGNYPEVYSFYSKKKLRILNFLINKIEAVILKRYFKRHKYIFSTGLFGLPITSHYLYNWADIIHLHWINQSFVSIKEISKIKKPIVWTVRDMWPLTGGCHYSMQCENYINKCGECFQLKSSQQKDLSSFILKRKINFYPQSINLVAISTWMKDQIKQSRVFRSHQVTLIYNGINTNIFYPEKKDLCKKKLDIHTEKTILLIGAQNPNSYYKGFNIFLEALKLLDPNAFYIVLFGKNSDLNLSSYGFEYKSFGYINDDSIMRLLYSVADVFVAPSLMEAFGKTITESMACETPVVCFDSAGPKDIVTHKNDGYKARINDVDDFAYGIKWLSSNKYKHSIAKNARIKVVDFFCIEKITTHYKELYQSIKND